MTGYRSGIVWALAMAAVAAPLAAHHSAAMYDRSRKVTVTGVVVRYHYANPHSWIDLAAKAADGSDQTWSFEAGTPGQMKMTGLTPEVLKVGDTVTVTGYPLRDGRTAGAYVGLVTADGRKFDTRAQGQTPQGPLVRQETAP